MERPPIPNATRAGSTLLVGDIGGTNARFAVATTGTGVSLNQPLSFRCDQFASIEAAIEAYLAQTNQSKPSAAVVAVAAPISNGQAVATNASWSLSEDGLQRNGFDRAQLINDYSALALAAPLLQGDDLFALGEPCGKGSGETIAIVGAGTGFGVGALVRNELSRSVSVAVTEGGHIAFAPTDDLDDQILAVLRERYGRVSIERILSGPGLADLRWAIGRTQGIEPSSLTPAQIIEAADTGEDPLCVQTLLRFCAIYGSTAGDLALALGATGGVLLGGGIGPRILTWLKAGEFRAKFEDKGRFTAYLASIRTAVIMDPYAALKGAATALS